MFTKKEIDALKFFSKTEVPIRPTPKDGYDFNGVAGKMRAVINGNKIKFFDLRHPFTEDGQFITEYYIKTILEMYDEDDDRRGLNLQGGVPSWRITSDEMNDVLAWLYGEVGNKYSSKKKADGKTPAEEYKKQMSEIKQMFSQMNNILVKIEKKYEKQLKDEPNSWAGIGRGADLQGLISQLKDAKQSMEYIK